MTNAKLRPLNPVTSALHNDEVTVTVDKINTLIKAAGVLVKPFWHDLFAKTLGSVDFGSLICNVGAGGATPDGAAPAGGALAASAPAQKAEEKKKESQQSDDDMVFGLFD
ncbi:large ribosomal subunit protein P1-like [Acipenser ruthenus]|uniref:large ribosomal subunit protein P1-like n=1 Tax=Acipenser ruthenus TaxID=7906 RepID=UPI00145BA3AA|nr:large ribosomal subunit protein P1-like [Acipenser ruthenus]